jgi:hypothetical protein
VCVYTQFAEYTSTDFKESGITKKIIKEALKPCIRYFIKTLLLKCKRIRVRVFVVWYIENRSVASSFITIGHWDIIQENLPVLKSFINVVGARSFKNKNEDVCITI